MSSNKNSTKSFCSYGFAEVYSPNAKSTHEFIVDIVLIHGLHGHPITTWKANNGCFWPADLLPAALQDLGTRILVYGYDASSFAFSLGPINGTTFDMLTKEAHKFNSDLAEVRKLKFGVSTSPIIFIAHGLGGLILKRALKLSDEAHILDATRPIITFTYGIVFLGTPHTGTDPTKWNEISRQMIDALIPETNSSVKHFETNIEAVRNANLSLIELIRVFDIYVLREIVEMGVDGAQAFTVDSEAANPLLGSSSVTSYEIPASHVDMCKFEDEESPGYYEISAKIKSWVRECPQRFQKAKYDEMNRKREPRSPVATSVDGKLEKDSIIPIIITNTDASVSRKFLPSPTKENDGFYESASSSKRRKEQELTTNHSSSNQNTPVIAVENVDNPIQKIGPPMLQHYITLRDVRSVTKVLEDQFEAVAQQNFEWLHELLDIGSSFEEIATLLIAEETGSPWVTQVPDPAAQQLRPLDYKFHQTNFVQEVFTEGYVVRTRIKGSNSPVVLDSAAQQLRHPDYWFHQTNCVHRGGLRVDIAPKIRPVGLSRELQPQDISSIRNLVSWGCGIAGILPPYAELVGKKKEPYHISFAGDHNSAAAIHYSSSESSLRPFLIDVLEGCLLVVGFLQTAGACCDNFSVLGVHQSFEGINIELCRLEISLINDLLQSLRDGIRKPSTLHGYSVDLALDVFELILGDRVRFTSGAFDDLHLCAIAVQMISIGLLSYSQGHIGKLHPEYLVDPLEEIYLFGSCSEVSSEHVVAELVNLTCLGNMLENPVLVFRFEARPTDSLGKQSKHNLWASPEDLADTWGPARFVASIADPHSLFAIEIGGGTIIRLTEEPWKLHWKIGASSYEGCQPFSSTNKMLIGGVALNENCPLDEDRSWKHPVTNAYLGHLGTSGQSWAHQETQVGIQGGQYAVLQFNATYVKQNGITLKQQQLMLPFNEIDLAFLNSACGLQISLCTGIARRVALRQLLADVMVPFIESRLLKPEHWEELKTQHAIAETFRGENIEKWFNKLPTPLQETTIQIVRNMLEVLKYTGIDRNGEELIIAWVRKESPYSCFRIRCEKTSLWARILADSEDCATFACITPLCLEIENHKCRNFEAAPWHNASNLLDTAVCRHLSSREITSMATSIVPWQLQHQVSYWIGKSGTNMIAKVWLTNDAEPRLLVRQKIIPEKYRSRMPRIMVDRLGRLRERQASDAIAKQVVILTEV